MGRLEALLNPGASHKGKLEKTADFLLSMPRSIVFGRCVKVIEKSDGSFDVAESVRNISKGPKSRSDISINSMGTALVALIAGACATLAGTMFLAVGVVLSPFVLTGFVLKKVALHNDPVALKYHELVKAQLNKEDLIAEKADIEQQLKENKTSLIKLFKEILPEGESYEHSSTIDSDMLKISKEVFAIQNENGDIPTIENLIPKKFPKGTCRYRQEWKETAHKVVKFSKRVPELEGQIKQAERHYNKALEEYGAINAIRIQKGFV